MSEFFPKNKILLYEPNEIIRGRKEILNFMKVSRWSVVKEYIDQGLPVAKVGRTWVSTKRLILEWFEWRIKEQVKAGLVSMQRCKK